MKSSRMKIIVFISIFFSLHYFWLFLWKDNDGLLLVGGDLFSIFASFISTIALFVTAQRNPMLGKPFWTFLSLGCFSFFVAEVVWAYYDCILRIDVPYPGVPDIFYILQILCYLTSILYLFLKLKGTYRLVKLIFDMGILITVTATFSWIYMIRPILAIPNISKIFLLVSLGYPIGDLVLIIVLVSIYIGFETPLIRRDLLFIFFGLIVQIFADSSYIYLVSSAQYNSGSQVDSLYTLALLLVGFSGFDSNNLEITKRNIHTEINPIKKLDLLRMSIPYLSIILLCVFLMFQKDEMYTLRIGSIVVILLIISRQLVVLNENKQNEKVIQFMAYHDTLTKLPNRLLFTELLQVEIADANRSNSILAVMFIDLDRFKTINDTLGHDVGDQLLIVTSKRLTATLRKSDIVGRYGGDEFTILIKGLNRVEDISIAANKIHQSLNQPYHVYEHHILSTPSIGIATYPVDGDKPETLLKKADFAMYQVKLNGRNHYRLYSTEQNGDLTKKYSVEKDLHHALSNHQFVVYYQPQIDIQKGKLIGVEALLRWNHPEFGMISPGDFIPIAEQTGLILPIGEWVLQTACRQVKDWHLKGHKIKMAINLSPRQFREKNLVVQIKEILEQTDIDPSFIDLEITEGIAMNDMNKVFQRLQALKQLGIKISIDDFGTGYSSLSYLTDYPVDSLKIPREFIKRIGEDPAIDAIIASIIALAHNLNINVLAEGVETEEQLQFLRLLDCDQVQGYFFSKAVTVKEMEENFSKLH